MKLDKWNESSTYRIVILAVLVITIGFIYSLVNGLETSITEYATAITTVLIPWLGREVKEAYFKPKQ